MDGDQGALNKFEHGEFSAGFHDIVVSLENVLGVAASDAALAIKTFASQFATPFGSQVLGLAVTAATGALQGQSVTQIAASITPQITADAVTDAEKAGQVTLDAVRVAVTSQLALPTSVAAPPSSSAPAA
jgi:hypothetical protein